MCFTLYNLSHEGCFKNVTNYHEYRSTTCASFLDAKTRLVFVGVTASTCLFVFIFAYLYLNDHELEDGQIKSWH